MGVGRDGTGRDRPCPAAGAGGGARARLTARGRRGGGGRRASAVRRHAVGSEKAPFGWEQMAGWGADRV